ncbi:MAG: hypothetical protein JNK04_15790 [Myxococcales bacterium]|nr:hypothetical protein [Myxococcales bacterium]
MRRLIASMTMAMVAFASVARAGDETLTPAELDQKERELRDELFREPAAARTRFATEVELGTQVDWVNDDQHGTLHGGFGFSFSPQEVENLRLASFYAGIAAGQIGDEAHRWVHLETGWRPNFELPVDSEFKPFLGGRHLLGMSSIGSDDGVDGTLANGASVGLRLLGGLLSVEVHGDAVFSWNREFLVDGERTHWVPRFGFNVKSDLCAFAGGDICEYPEQTPEDVDLSALMDEALADLTVGLSPPPAKQCAHANVAVTLQVEKLYPKCLGADAEGFFCRFKEEARAANGSETEDYRLIELARLVHGDLEACYNQSRVDERTAAKTGKLLRRKLRYGAYPPELRSAVCNAGGPPLGEDAEATRCDKVERARLACPRAAKSRDVLAARVREIVRARGPK